MTMTLGEACDRLRGYEHAYGVESVVDGINNAVKALSHLSPWQCLRRVLRFTSASPVFALPQGCAGLVRACVNGRPSTLRGQDFRFLQAGPGDMGRPPFCPVHPKQILDLGMHPVIVEPSYDFKPFAVSTGTNEPPLRVTGLDSSDRRITVEVPVQSLSSVTSDTAETVDATFKMIESVVLDRCASKVVQLYAAKASDDTARAKIAEYHPGVRVPEFHHYMVDGFPLFKPVELLTEVRLDPYPLVDPDDVLPFDDVEPIQYMIMYDWKMRSSEIDVAQKYMNQAIQWLKAQENTEDTVQTEILLNVPYEGSMGEISDYVRMV